MLGKLIKYDMKALNRFLIIIHAFLLLAALFIRFFITNRIHFTGEEDSVLLILTYILAFMLIVGASFATQIIIAVRFYKNLFSDEGYLTNTLPVTRGQHLLSKTIAGTIWECIDIVLIILSLYIIIATSFVIDIARNYKAEILTELGFVGKYANYSPTAVLIVFLLFYFTSLISNVVTIYASVALGQFFTSHRVLGAVAAYFALTTILSVITCAIMALFGVLSVTVNPDRYATEFNFLAYMITLTKISVISSLIITVILYVLTHFIMKKKVNLA